MLCALFLAGLIAGCGEPPPESGLVTVDAPWVAENIPPNRITAAYLILQNHTSAPTTLVRVETDIARVVELHEMAHTDGIMTMRKIDRIDIPAKSSVALKPGGLHLMFIGLHKDLNAGDIVPITLHFNDNSQKTLMAPVKKPNHHAH